ncbi:hypothetical protein HCN44_000831 [Aphidius gifuensis]|uniref:Uncharacterized protein n=1 Tax=Aphidius gifuensis TaxID=684658 RepID=A0A834XRR8_APHGI|nr:hypothetical protein HCN44_000831 [Aphidius gifuensis]
MSETRPQKRKRYIRDISIRVPRSTKYSWKKKKFTPLLNICLDRETEISNSDRHVENQAQMNVWDFNPFNIDGNINTDKEKSYEIAFDETFSVGGTTKDYSEKASTSDNDINLNESVDYSDEESTGNNDINYDESDDYSEEESSTENDINFEEPIDCSDREYNDNEDDHNDTSESRNEYVHRDLYADCEVSVEEIVSDIMDIYFVEAKVPQISTSEHHFCKNCRSYRPTDCLKEICESCETTSDTGIFYELDIHSQIQFLFEHRNLAEKLMPFEVRKDRIISDVKDGKEYIRVHDQSVPLEDQTCEKDFVNDTDPIHSIATGTNEERVVTISEKEGFGFVKYIAGRCDDDLFEVNLVPGDGNYQDDKVVYLQYLRDFPGNKIHLSFTIVPSQHYNWLRLKENTKETEQSIEKNGPMEQKEINSGEDLKKVIQETIREEFRGAKALLNDKEKENNFDVQTDEMGNFCQGLSRRSGVAYHVNPVVLKAVENTKVDEYLFGKDLQEKIKTAQSVDKTSSSISKYSYQTDRSELSGDKENRQTRFSEILRYISDRVDEAKSYSTLNTARSALSFIVTANIGDEKRIKRFFKGIDMIKRPRPKYDNIWNPKEDIEIPTDEVMIHNEITVDETVRENHYVTPVDDPVVENEIPTGEVMIYNEITVDETVRENNNETPVDGPVAENKIPVDVEKNDMANTDQKYETAAELFANAQLEIKENEPVEEELDKFLGDLVQNALEENGLGEKIYSEIKKPAITSVEILPPTKRITMNSKKITKKQKGKYL